VQQFDFAHDVMQFASGRKPANGAGTTTTTSTTMTTMGRRVARFPSTLTLNSLRRRSRGSGERGCEWRIASKMRQGPQTGFVRRGNVQHLCSEPGCAALPFTMSGHVPRKVFRACRSTLN